MQVISEISGELSDCTICQGIEVNQYDDNNKVVGRERIGAIADVDLFACFTVDMSDAAEILNRYYMGNVKAKGDLWEVSKRRETRFDNAIEKTTQDGKVGVAELQRRLAAGVDLWTGEAIEEESEGDDE